MRSKKMFYNLLAAVILQLITLVVSIILPRVMIYSFSSEINGLVSSIRQFINYLTIVEAGLSGACIYSLYKPLAERDISEINGILSGTKKFYNRSGVIFSVLALGLSVVFPYIAKSEDISDITIILLVLILGMNGSLEFFSMGKYRVLLTADQRGYIISIVQAIAQVINCTITVIMSLKGYSIVVVQLIATISYIVRSIIFNMYIKKVYKYIDFDVNPKNNALHQRWDVLFHQIGSMVVFNSPIALITFFCSLEEVSVYTVYNMVFAGIAAIVGIFNSGLVAGIGDIISRNNQKRLQNIYQEYECGYYMIVTWMYSCTYILILPFIELYTKGITDAKYIRIDLAYAFIALGILNVLRTPQNTLVNAAGHFKQTRYRALIEVIINIIASTILVNYYGMIGVLMGGICSYTYRTLDFIFYAPKYITKLSVKKTLIRIVRGGILGLIIILPFELAIKIKVDNFIQWGGWGCIVSIWGLLIVLIGNYITEKKTIKTLFNRVFIMLGMERLQLIRQFF